MRALQTLPDDLWTQLQVVKDESNLLAKLPKQKQKSITASDSTVACFMPLLTRAKPGAWI